MSFCQRTSLDVGDLRSRATALSTGQFPGQRERQQNDRGDEQHRRGKAYRVADQSI